jgi:hypothetical protein
VKLYGGTARNAAAEGTDVIPRVSEFSKAQSEKLQTDITDNLAALSAPLHLDARELRDLNTIILHRLLAMTTGKPTGEKTDRWTDEGPADLKSRHLSMKRVHEVIHDCNCGWRRSIQKSTERSRTAPAWANHPKFVGKLTDRFLAPESWSPDRALAAGAQVLCSPFHFSTAAMVFPTCFSGSIAVYS